MNERVISYQLYSARKFPPVERILESLAEIGYRAVEPYAPVYNDDPTALRKLLDRLGLVCPTAHMGFRALNDDFRRQIDIAHTLGVETIVVPFLTPDERPAEAAGWIAIARQLSVHAAAAKEHGFRFAWHNHDFEYKTLADGGRPIDILLSAADVFWEADVGWIVRAKGDLRGELARYADRIVALHAKDVSSDSTSNEDGWADVGYGSLDWRSFWPILDRSALDVLVVEHDNPIDWRASAARSFGKLSTLNKRS